MSIYSFNSNVLSAAKNGNPPITNASLSSTGVTYVSGNSVQVASRNVGIVSLSSDDVGLIFNPVEFSIGTTVNTTSAFSLTSYPSVTVNVLGSVFNIPNALHNTQIAVVNSDRTYSVFTWLSSTTTVRLSDISLTSNVSSPESRRMRLLGYY
jgi:hypothetical protein